MSVDLIDTTEMYLKTIYELEEDGIVPLRARIVERLGHSGPTVSQTVGRMERDGLVTVREDRRLELTEEGRAVAQEVMRKHRLAERLLVDVIGMDWIDAHEEACRWEHVMSKKVEEQLPRLLGDPLTDPYGNPIPGPGQANPAEKNLQEALASSRPATGNEDGIRVVVTRIGEPIQAEEGLLASLKAAQIGPGSPALVRGHGEHFEVVGPKPDVDGVYLDHVLATHLFVVPAPTV